MYILPQFFKKSNRAMMGVVQWTECQPANQKVTGSIPSQGTCLGCLSGGTLVGGL